MPNKYSSHLWVLLLLVGLFSCNDDENIAPIDQTIPVDTIPETTIPGENGYLILNAGGFGNGNTSISYFNSSDNTVTQDVFVRANETPLGDQGESIENFNDNTYIAVQNSGKVEVIDDEYKIVTTIDTPSPRHFIGINETKGYISDWGADGVSGTIQVVDLTTFEITKTIATGSGTDEMILVNGKVYANNTGGWGDDNTVTVINPETDEVIKKINTGDTPSHMILDADNNIWLTGEGNLTYNEDWSLDLESSTKGFLSKIDTKTDEVVLTFEAAEANIGPKAITINEGVLYFDYQNNLYSLSTDATADAEFSLFLEKTFYGLAVDPSTGYIIGLEAPDFGSNGNMYRHDTNGTLIDQYEVGIAPIDCIFN